MLLGYCSLLIFGFIGDVVLTLSVHARGGRTLLIGSEIVTFLAAIVGGAITARTARARALAHASALALTIFSVTIVVALVLPPPKHALYPHWYPFASAILGGVGAFVGGALIAMRRETEQ